MLHIPRITPVRVKDQPISPELIDPRSNEHYFPSEVGPRVVYLDDRYDYPPQDGNDPWAERARQMSIWERFQADGGVQFLDRMAEEEAGSDWLEIQDSVREELGTHHSAEYFERIFSQLFAENMNVVIISTGVTTFSRQNYHDIGYLR